MWSDFLLLLDPSHAIDVRTEHPPVLDGLITEAQCQTAPAALDFTQFDPIEGGLPTEMTSVRMLYTCAVRRGHLL